MIFREHKTSFIAPEKTPKNTIKFKVFITIFFDSVFLGAVIFSSFFKPNSKSLK